MTKLPTGLVVWEGGGSFVGFVYVSRVYLCIFNAYLGNLGPRTVRVEMIRR